MPPRGRVLAFQRRRAGPERQPAPGRGLPRQVCPSLAAPKPRLTGPDGASPAGVACVLFTPAMVTWAAAGRSVEDVPGTPVHLHQDLTARIVGSLYFSVNAVADPPQLRVVVTGELDVLSASGLRGAVARRSADGCRSVVVDLDGVTFIDCTGLSALLACQQEVAASGGSFSVAALSAAVTRVTELTGTTGRFDTMTLESA